jgi:hypothetical protein
MRAWELASTPQGGEVTAQRAAGAVNPQAAMLLSLQRDVGNQAVTNLVAGPQEEEGAPGQRPNLDVGDHGPGVALLHRKLAEHGYGFRGGDPNVFSQETHAVVVRFQSDHPQLHPPTGGVGPGTWALLDAPTVQGAVDDTIVKDIIKGALWAETKGSEHERCENAVVRLKARRDREDPTKPADVNLAAAEHYMFARYMSSGYMPGAAMNFASVVYFGIKALGGTYKSGGGPVSETSPADLNWAFLGAHDGAWSTMEFDKEIPTTNTKAPIEPKAH